MGLVDILIIGFIFIGGIVGWKRGVIKEAVSAIGIVLITVLSFIFKNPLSVILYENLPFFKFGGIFKGVTVLNIALYELVAFLIVFSILMILWRIVAFASGIVQKIIDMTIILGLPSKILGFLIGLVEYYLISFVVIYILVLPIFSVKEVVNSRYANIILEKTPIISSSFGEKMGFLNEFVSLKEKYKNTESATQFNYDTLDLFLKYDIINVNSAKKLREKNKLKIDGIDNLLKKYEEE